MKNTRIMFMGTPDFAATILQGLVDNNYNVVAVVSQPDRPVGRKKIIEPTPTKKIALSYNIPVYQCESIRNENEFVKQVNPDLIITCAYGQFIPKVVLDVPSLGCINVHGSLLPKLRGGAPIHHAIIDGEEETGISIMQMISKMDAGKVYATCSTKIVDEDDLESLYSRMQVMGRDLLLKVLPDYLEGKLEGVEQDENLVTFGYNITKEEERIDWSKTARQNFNHIRGLCPTPGAYTMLNGNVFKIYKSEIVDNNKKGTPGKIFIKDKEMFVECGTGILKLVSIKPFGKARMDANQYLNGLSQKQELRFE